VDFLPALCEPSRSTLRGGHTCIHELHVRSVQEARSHGYGKDRATFHRGKLPDIDTCFYSLYLSDALHEHASQNGAMRCDSLCPL
jgi:hypothetical protein